MRGMRSMPFGSEFEVDPRAVPDRFHDHMVEFVGPFQETFQRAVRWHQIVRYRGDPDPEFRVRVEGGDTHVICLPKPPYTWKQLIP